MAIINLTSVREFVSKYGVILLDAASTAGIALPYSCRTGRCRTCKTLVQRGHTRLLSDEVGLSLEEVEAGWILTCVRTAETDVTLDIEELDAVQLPYRQSVSQGHTESLMHVPDDQQPQSITMLWGADFYIHLRSITANHRYIPVISRPNEGWTDAKGHTQDILLSIASDLNRLFTPCRHNMIDDTNKLLSNAGLTKALFY